MPVPAFLLLLISYTLSAATTAPAQADASAQHAEAAMRLFLSNATATSLLYQPEQRRLPYCNITHVEDHFKCDPSRFTVLILSGRPQQYVERLILHYEQYAEVAGIVVVWNHPHADAPHFTHAGKKPFSVWETPSPSMHHRFYPFPGTITTCAVFSTDDDLLPSSREDVLFMFRLWQHHQNLLVGPYGRGVQRAGGQYVYPTTGLQHHTYALILAGFAFMHRYHLYAFTCHLKQAGLDRVEAVQNCDDILLNFMVSGLASKPGLLVSLSGHLTDYGKSNGQHSHTGHYSNRSRCLNEFPQIFGADMWRHGGVVYARVEDKVYPLTVGPDPPGAQQQAQGQQQGQQGQSSQQGQGQSQAQRSGSAQQGPQARNQQQQPQQQQQQERGAVVVSQVQDGGSNGGGGGGDGGGGGSSNPLALVWQKLTRGFQSKEGGGRRRRYRL